MKKLITLILIILSTLTLTGCQKDCEQLDEEPCKTDHRCVNKYKPCNLSDPGCSSDNTTFTGCFTKKPRN